MKALIDAFIAGNASLEPTIKAYITAQAKLQAVPNQAGALDDGSGLGEPRFNRDGTANAGPWGRPQRDGPALRATAIIAYARHLLGTGNSAAVRSILWPIISNDLAYIGQYWNQTGVDLWEETHGSSFFALAAQHRALAEGSALAAQIGAPCAACDSQAPQILCFLQGFWEGQFFLSNLNAANGRTGRDCAAVLASIATFDPAARCDDTTFQPCSARALSNHKVLVDAFRAIYPINAGAGNASGVAVGRYPEDVYFGGNPWLLCTTAAAEQLYDALYPWRRTGAIQVTDTSRDFFNAFAPRVARGTYNASTDTFKFLTRAVKSYADSFMSVVEKSTPANGTLFEQFLRNDGSPASAIDLTWSCESTDACDRCDAG